MTEAVTAANPEPWIHRGNVVALVERAVELHRERYPREPSSYWTDYSFRLTFPTDDHARRVECEVYGALGWISLAAFEAGQFESDGRLDDAKLILAELSAMGYGTDFCLWPEFSIDGRPFFERDQREPGMEIAPVARPVYVVLNAVCETNRDKAVEVARNVLAAVEQAERIEAERAAEAAREQADYDRAPDLTEQDLVKQLSLLSPARYRRVLDETNVRRVWYTQPGNSAPRREPDGGA